MKAYNKDIMHWRKFPNYDIIWCDPPWENKMVKFFETMMFKKGYNKPNNTIDGIINKLSSLSDKDKPIFIEYSNKGSDFIIEIMKKKGHVFNKKVHSTQENGNPYVILVFNTDFIPDGRFKGFSIIDYTCLNFKFLKVFDPFAGVGKIAVKFIKNNKIYIGSEVNPIRFQKLKKAIWAEQQ